MLDRNLDENGGFKSIYEVLRRYKRRINIGTVFSIFRNRSIQEVSEPSKYYII